MKTVHKVVLFDAPAEEDVKAINIKGEDSKIEPNEDYESHEPLNEEHEMDIVTNKTPKINYPATDGYVAPGSEVKQHSGSEFRPVNHHNKNRTKYLQCKYCGKQFQLRNALLIHLNKYKEMPLYAMFAISS